MRKCLICHRPVSENQRSISTTNPVNPFAKGKMHLSCYKVMKIFDYRSLRLPFTWFIMGLILMVMLLIPGLIAEEKSLEITAIVVVVIITMTSLLWWGLMYRQAWLTCRRYSPILKNESWAHYESKSRHDDFAIPEESFDHFQNDSGAIMEGSGSYQRSKIRYHRDWALKFMALSPQYTEMELNQRFTELSKIYQPSVQNNYGTKQMQELLMAVKILRPHDKNRSKS